MRILTVFACAVLFLTAKWSTTAFTPTIPEKLAACAKESGSNVYILVGYDRDRRECEDMIVHVRNEYFGYECTMGSEDAKCTTFDLVPAVKEPLTPERLCRTFTAKANWALSRGTSRIWIEEKCSAEPPQGVAYMTISFGVGSNQVCTFPGTACVPVLDLKGRGLGRAMLETSKAMGAEVTNSTRTKVNDALKKFNDLFK